MDRLDAVIFDLDGVITDTASVHAAAWREMFDRFLSVRQDREGRPQGAFSGDDYYLYVDGKPRYDGVESFLQSRGISIPRGGPDDPPTAETVCGLGNRKDELFLARLRSHGVNPLTSSVSLLRRLRGDGRRTAIVSSSRNCAEVVQAAGVADLFDAKVDGMDSDELGLAGKPDPAIYLEAARRLAVDPARAAVVEDALAGVEAGRRGRFALVIGVDLGGHERELRERGADIVVRDLGELSVPTRTEGDR